MRVEDLHRLEPGSFLNDEIMNVAMADALRTSTPKCDVHVFSTYAFQLLVNEVTIMNQAKQPTEHVIAKRRKKLYISLCVGVPDYGNLLDKDLLVVVITDERGMHFSVGFIFNPRHFPSMHTIPPLDTRPACMVHLDSSSGIHTEEYYQEHFETLLCVLREHDSNPSWKGAKRKLDVLDRMAYLNLSRLCVQQGSGTNDCGIHAISYVQVALNAVAPIKNKLDLDDFLDVAAIHDAPLTWIRDDLAANALRKMLRARMCSVFKNETLKVANLFKEMEEQAPSSSNDSVETSTEDISATVLWKRVNIITEVPMYQSTLISFAKHCSKLKYSPVVEVLQAFREAKRFSPHSDFVFPQSYFVPKAAWIEPGTRDIVHWDTYFTMSPLRASNSGCASIFLLRDHFVNSKGSMSLQLLM
mmetsp:Transcript_34167/g.65273  ORF Transcript_34167/g.65273 Transcript_34167/m.65273 type:complete len:414 (+) Transcript_34167:38-1279(+)